MTFVTPSGVIGRRLDCRGEVTVKVEFDDRREVSWNGEAKFCAPGTYCWLTSCNLHWWSDSASSFVKSNARPDSPSVGGVNVGEMVFVLYLFFILDLSFVPRALDLGIPDVEADRDLEDLNFAPVSWPN